MTELPCKKSLTLRSTPSHYQRKTKTMMGCGRLLDFGDRTARIVAYSNQQSISKRVDDPLNPIKHDRRLSCDPMRVSRGLVKKRATTMKQLLPPIDVSVSALACVSLKGESTSKVKEFNQDACISLPSFCGNEKTHLFAVFDGHGEDGHRVAEFLKETFPKVLAPTVHSFLNGHLSIAHVKEELKTAFLKVQADLCRSLPFHTDDSGSTAVLTLLINDNLFCASVGDSRAVLGSKSIPWRATALTHDHRPESPSERSRIVMKHGRVESKYLPEKETYGPMRVWLPSKDVPGLAMSRSLGDAVVHEYGVSAEPDVVYRKLRGNDRMVLLASDGLWNFMENDEAVMLASHSYERRDAERSCRCLAREATKRWKADGTSVDDITVLVVYIN